MGNETGTLRKYSKKREAILGMLRATKEHPSAEMVYAALKPDYPDLSLGTVYRNLSYFVESGDLICIGTVGGQVHYDADTSDHAHFVCSGCSKILDLKLDGSMSALYEHVEDEIGAAVEGHSLIFRGCCSDCS